MTDAKFEQNRNKFRRVYGYGGRFPPVIKTYTDNITGLQHQRDFNQIIRDRDMFLIGVMQSQFLTSSIAEYAENLVTLLNTDTTYTVVFPVTFTGTPIVTVQIDSSSIVGNVNPYILSVNTTQFTFGLSAPSSGSVRYKAVNLPIGQTFPASITRGPLYPSLTGIVSAGTSSLTNSTQVTMSFNPVNVFPPSEFSFITQDNGNNQSDVFVQQQTLSTNNSLADLTSNFTGKINFISIK